MSIAIGLDPQGNKVSAILRGYAWPTLGELFGMLWWVGVIALPAPWERLAGWRLDTTAMPDRPWEWGPEPGEPDEDDPAGWPARFIRPRPMWSYPPGMRPPSREPAPDADEDW